MSREPSLTVVTNEAAVDLRHDQSESRFRSAEPGPCGGQAVMGSEPGQNICWGVLKRTSVAGAFLAFSQRAGQLQRLVHECSEEVGG
jgi:hypothetical protein